MEKVILVVDDTSKDIEDLNEILQGEYSIMTAEDGDTALKSLKQDSKILSAVLVKLGMPNIDTVQFIKEVMEKEYMSTIPVLLIITADDVRQREDDCFKLGVCDYIRIPFHPLAVRQRLKTLTDIFQYKKDLEEKVRVQTEQMRSQNMVLIGQAKELRQSNQNIIDILGTVVECRNLESGIHIKHVKEYTKILAEQMQQDYPEYELTDSKIEVIVNASALHDIGKIAIPDEILLKPGKLTREEFDYMKSHTTRGCEILQNIKGTWGKTYDKYCYDICRHHHERYDGKGYPDGLVGEEIPISAQLVSLADVYDALVAERCYKEAFSKAQAFGMVMQGECGTFSPKLLEAFRKAKDKLEAVP